MSAAQPAQRTPAYLHPECATVEQASEMYLPVARTMAQGDEDMQQELMFCVIDSVGNRKISDGSRIVGRMLDQRKAYKSGYLAADRYGHSVDNGCAKRRKGITLIPYDPAAEWQIKRRLNQTDLAIYFTPCRSPEETALFNVVYERFLNDLDIEEREYWDARLNGLLAREIERRKITRRNLQATVKRRIREKFRKWFGE